MPNWLRVFAGAVWAGAALSASAEQLFLKLDGIDGEAVEARHQNWIEVDSFGEGVSKAAGSRPAFESLRLTKRIDKTSPVLANRCWGGRQIQRGVLEVLRGADGGAVRYLQVNLTNISVSEFHQIATRDSAPQDSLALDFVVIEWVYTQIDPRGVPGAQVRCLWNRKTGTGVGEEDDDADGDGLPLTYEQLYGLDPGKNDANGDLDGDGATNMEEFRAGTVPNRSDSVFRMTGRRLPSGQVEIRWEPAPDRTYKIFASPTAQGPYSEVGPVDPSSAGSLLFEASRLRQFFIIQAE